MRKLFLLAVLSLTLSTAVVQPAFAGMNNSFSESFNDDLPEIDVETEEPDIPEIDTPNETEAEDVPEESKEDSKEQDETEAPVEETKTEEVKESEPEKEVVIRDDNNNTPEKSSRVIYAHRNVVICDNEPIMTEPETTAEETEESISETVEEEIETIPETLDHKVPEKSSSSSLPKTADFSDLMIAGVAVLAVVAAAFAVVANRRKANA